MDFSELIKYTREIIFRSRLAIPVDEEEFVWFNQGINPELIKLTLSKTKEWRVLPESKTTADEILNVVCNEYGITTAELHTRTRIREIVEARQMAVYLMKNYTKLSLRQIGEKVGGFDHATVVYGYSAIENFSKTDRKFAERLSGVQNLLIG
jgi:chromosomal replication initiator protein